MNTKYLFTNTNNYSIPNSIPYSETPLSKQSKKYKKYQNKLLEQVKLNHKQLFYESFGNMDNNNSNNNNINLESTNYTTNSMNVLKSATPTPAELQANENLLQNYNTTLQQYNSLLQNTASIVENYYKNKFNNTNSYLGKNIQFTDGTIAYVTKQGVVKAYDKNDPNVFNSTFGLNGCPSNSPIPINISWQTAFNTPETVIMNTPRLISGTPMTASQSCGNEGENILINSLSSINNIAPVLINSTTTAEGFSNNNNSTTASALASTSTSATAPTISYNGCYKDSYSSPVMDYLSPINTTDIASSQLYSFEDCEKSAIINGYPYFGLQNVNQTSNLGICSLSKDLTKATSLGLSKLEQTVYEPVTLWSSNTTTGVSATLTECGQVQVMDANGSVIFSVPENSPDKSSYYNGEIYYEYLAPSCNPLNPNPNTQYNGNYHLNIGNQLTLWYGTGVWWWPSVVGGISYPGYGFQYESSGPIFVYDGGYNVLNSVYPNLLPNTNYTAVKGKTGVPSMVYNTVLNQGEFIGNTEGSLYLIMDTDGNLKLNTTTMIKVDTTPSCSKLFSSDYYGGSVNSNAIYNVNPVANPSSINKIYYVNPDAQLYSYPSEDIGLSTSYTTFSNYDSPNNDIPGLAANNVTLEQCQTICNNNDSCSGVVYNATNKNCLPKSSGMWPYVSNAVYNTDSNIYLRNNSILKAPPGISLQTTNVDSVTAKNYGSAQGQVFETSNSKLLIQDKNEITQNMAQLQALEQKLNNLAQQLTANNISIDTNNYNVNNQSTKDRELVAKFFKEYNEIEEKNKHTRNFDGILNDSDIVVLQKNYSYILWSILAIGIVIVTLNIIRR